MSLTTLITSGITHFRNPNGTEDEWTHLSDRERVGANPIRVILAEVLYVATVPLAVVETALSFIATAFATCLNSDIRFTTTGWSRNCILGLYWATGNLLFNLVCNDLLVYPANVDRCIRSGNFFSSPELVSNPRLSHVDRRMII